MSVSSYRWLLSPTHVYQRNPIDDSEIRAQAILFDEAIFRNDIATVKKMMTETPALVNYELQLQKGPKSDPEFRLPLQTSIQYASDELTEILLKAGAKATTDDAHPLMYPPFYSAFIYRKHSIIRLMLERGANPNYTITHPMALWRKTVLEMALEQEYPCDVVNSLLDHGADPTDTALKRAGIPADPLLSTADKVELLRKKCMQLGDDLRKSRL